MYVGSSVKPRKKEKKKEGKIRDKPFNHLKLQEKRDSAIMVQPTRN